MRFEQGVERFAAQYVSRRTGKPFTAATKRNVLDNLLGSPLTAFRARHGISIVDEWNGDHAADYLTWLQTELRRDSATVKKVRSQLRAFADFSEQVFHTSGAATTALATLEVSQLSDYARTKDPPFSAADLLTLGKAAPTPRDHLIIAMLLCTGMRPSELVALDAHHIRVDRTPEVVEIRGSAQHPRLSDSNPAVRDVPLTIGQRSLPMLLRAHLADQQRPRSASKLFLSKRTNASREWQPLTLEGLRAMLFDLGKATGIRCNAYRFRHTFCVLCADGGLDMLYLQRLLGQRNSDMVAPYYRTKPSKGVFEAVARLHFPSLA